MKYYERMVESGGFSRRELAGLLSLSDTATSAILQNYLRKGYIDRVRHDLYVVISLESKQPVLSRYEIANRIYPDACVSHHSSFEVYGYANQVFYEVYVTTACRFTDFEYNSVRYIRVAPKGSPQSDRVNGVRVTGLEQTIIDSIQSIDRIGGLEELLRCLALIPALDEKKLLLALSEHNNGFLYQKTGFILEQFRNSLGLSDEFLSACEYNSPKADRYLTKNHGGYVYNSKWRLMGPRDLIALINKGVDYSNGFQ